MRDLNYHHLAYFRAVAHEGNLTRAARRLHLSQSALSVQIKKLEEQLGQALFERRGRQLELTEAGRIALDHADAIFATGSELLDTLRSGARARQNLRVGAAATLSRNFQIGFLAPVFPRLDVQISLQSGRVDELLVGLADMNLDVVLVNQPPSRTGEVPFISHLLAEQTISLVGTPEQVQGKSTLKALLKGSPLILPNPESPMRGAFDALVHRRGLSASVIAEVDDMAMMRLLARSGAGLAVLPPIVVRDELDSALLIEALRLPDIKEQFYAVTLERRYPNPLLDTVLPGPAGD